MREVARPVDDAAARVHLWTTAPDRRAWAEDYLRASNSDADALRAFGPRDGRDPG